MANGLHEPSQARLSDLATSARAKSAVESYPVDGGRWREDEQEVHAQTDFGPTGVADEGPLPRQIEASVAVVRYVRSTSTPAVRGAKTP